MRKILSSLFFVVIVLTIYSDSGRAVDLPRLVIAAPPVVVVIPGTYVYVIPDIDADIVFYHGHWYRLYKGQWYRATSYNGPWVIHPRVPPVLLKLPPDFRHIPPEHERIPYGQLKKHWRIWEKERHWDKHTAKEIEKEHHKEMKEEMKEEKKEKKKGEKKH